MCETVRVNECVSEYEGVRVSVSVSVYVNV